MRGPPTARSMRYHNLLSPAHFFSLSNPLYFPLVDFRTFVSHKVVCVFISHWIYDGRLTAASLALPSFLCMSFTLVIRHICLSN